MTAFSSSLILISAQPGDAHSRASVSALLTNRPREVFHPAISVAVTGVPRAAEISCAAACRSASRLAASAGWTPRTLEGGGELGGMAASAGAVVKMGGGGMAMGGGAAEGGGITLAAGLPSGRFKNNGRGSAGPRPDSARRTRVSGRGARATAALLATAAADAAVNVGGGGIDAAGSEEAEEGRGVGVGDGCGVVLFVALLRAAASFCCSLFLSSSRSSSTAARRLRSSAISRVMSFIASACV